MGVALVVLPAAACARTWTVVGTPVGSAVRVAPEEIHKLTSPIDVLKVRLERGGEPILVRRLRGKLVAVSGRCTHSGCELMSDPEGFGCPCHGSRFDRRGRRLEGPATVDLPTAAVREEGGAAFIEVGP